MELFKIFGSIAIDNTKAKKALDETSDAANESAEETESAFAKIGGVAKNIALGIGTAGIAIGGALVGAVESTREYRQQMGLLETAFITAGHSSESAKKTYSELNAVLGDSGQAVEASQHLAKLTDNEKELETWTNICTGVYATFGESLPIEGLAEASNETAKTGQLTGGLTDALNWAGISEEKFQEKLDKCTNEQERQKLIMETLNNTYSDASAQYQETNKDVLEANKAQERLSDAFAEVGAVCEPIMTAIKNAIADMAENIAPAIEKTINKFKDMSQWVKDNENTIHTWVAVILGASVAVGTFLLILNWGAIMSAASKAIGLVRTAILAMNTAMLANPIGLIVALIAGLVVAFIYLWNNCEGFRKFWIELWKVIKEKASEAWEWIKKVFSGIGKWFSEKFAEVQKSGKETMDKTKKWFSDAWSGIKKVWSAVVGFFKGVWSGIKSAFNATVSWFTKLFKNAWNGIKSIWNGVKSFFSGIWSGIKGVFGSVGSWFKSKFQSAWSGIKSVFSGWGSFFSGLWSKIKSKFSSIGSSLGTSMGKAVKSGMNSVISLIEKTINKGIGLINSAIKIANKLPLVNVGTVPKLSLPRLAKGAVVDRATPAIVGEDGAEAIVPLERNTQWIGKVSERLNIKPSVDYDSKLNRIIELLEQLMRRNIYLDTGVMVGELAPLFDTEFGSIADKRIRGNL